LGQPNKAEAAFKQALVLQSHKELSLAQVQPLFLMPLMLFLFPDYAHTKAQESDTNPHPDLFLSLPATP
jgi:hypothetical protein